MIVDAEDCPELGIEWWYAATLNVRRSALQGDTDGLACNSTPASGDMSDSAHSRISPVRHLVLERPMFDASILVKRKFSDPCLSWGETHFIGDGVQVSRILLRQTLRNYGNFTQVSDCILKADTLGVGR